VLEAGLDSWRELLSQVPPALDLPADRPRPARQTFAGDVVPVSVPGDVTAALTRLGLEEGATLFMVLLAAYAVLLARTSGQPELVIGTPVAGRPAAELERLIGFFVNMLPLRADLSGRPTFRELLRQVRETTLSAFAVQHVPFERLVEELQPERDLSRTPLFSTMLALQNLPAARLELPGLRAERVFGPTGMAKYDLSLVLTPAGDGLDGALDYNTDLFDAGTAERFVEHLQIVLRGIAAEPDTRVDDLPVAGAAELHRVRAEWNATAADIPETSLTGMVEAAAGRYPAAIAICAPDGDLTYAELHRRSLVSAAALRRAGVGPGTIVGLLCGRRRGGEHARHHAGRRRLPAAGSGLPGRPAGLHPGRRRLPAGGHHRRGAARPRPGRLRRHGPGTRARDPGGAGPPGELPAAQPG
jgi:non-ribosomal peptide synthetase component F